MRALIAVALTFLSAHSALAQETVLDRADQLAQDRKWEEAAAAYRAVLEEEPTNGRAWYQLGYVQFELDDREGAASSFQKAGEHGFRPGDSWYNVACAYSLMNRQDEAIDWLAKALDSGFTNLHHIAQDSDLDNIRENPRFKEIYTPPVYEKHPDAVDVQFEADEGVTVYAEWYPAKLDADSEDAPVVLLFHQAGSNGAEYQTIAPRLSELGFHCLAVDARGGGPSYGRENRTTSEFMEATGERGGGEQAIHDFHAAVRWVRDNGHTGKLTAWGSSYSAGRLFQLITDLPDEFAAAVSMSPGRAFVRTGPNGEPSWASRTRVPVLVSWPPDEFDDDARERFEAIAHRGKVLLIQETGTHGSSTFRPDRNPGGWEANWARLEEFLLANAR